MKKEPKKLIFGAIPIVLLFILPLIFVGFDFFWGNTFHLHRWLPYFSTSETDIRARESMEFLLSRLVQGEDRRNLEATGFACDKAYHYIVCVVNRQVRIDTSNMTVLFSSDGVFGQETIVRPYARQEDDLKVITPVYIVTGNTTSPPDCIYNHDVPAIIFSSGSTGNVFHEINEIIIPLFITSKHLQSRVIFVLEDYKPSFIRKYNKIISHLSSYEVINPARNRSVHCFPGSVVGLKYHDSLGLNSSDIPRGHTMSEFRDFLRQVYDLKFTHVSQIKQPRLMLLSRRNTRRFLNEDEMVTMIEELGFEVIVAARSKIISNLDKFSQLVNSCSVLVGAHGAGLTNELFLPSGAVMVQVEFLGTEWGSTTYYGNPARVMRLHYLRYKIEPDESTLSKLYGRNHSAITDLGYLFRTGGYRAARAVYLDQQNVRINLSRFRDTLVEALSLVTYSDF